MRIPLTRKNRLYVPYDVLTIASYRKDLEAFETLRAKAGNTTEHNNFTETIDIMTQVLNFMLEKNKDALQKNR